MKKLLSLCVMCILALVMNAQNYVDLGLPSGTLWASINEKRLYTYDEAIEKFGQSLPSQAQWEELLDYCEWNWNGRGGYKVVGPSGKFIFLPGIDLYHCDGSPAHSAEAGGTYWSSTSYPHNKEEAYTLSCGQYGFHLRHHERCQRMAVRLVD